MELVFNNIEQLIQRLSNENSVFLNDYIARLLSKFKATNQGTFIKNFHKLQRLGKESKQLGDAIALYFKMFEPTNYPVIIESLSITLNKAIEYNCYSFLKKFLSNLGQVKLVFKENFNWRAKVSFMNELSAFDVTKYNESASIICAFLIDVEKNEVNLVKFPLIDTFFNLLSQANSTSVKIEFISKLQASILSDFSSRNAYSCVFHFANQLTHYFSIKFIYQCGTVEKILSKLSPIFYIELETFLNSVYPVVLQNKLTDLKLKIENLLSKSKYYHSASLIEKLKKIEKDFISGKTFPCVLHNLEKEETENILNELHLNESKRTNSTTPTVKQNKVPVVRRTKHTNTEKLKSKPFLLKLDPTRRLSKDLKSDKKLLIK